MYPHTEIVVLANGEEIEKVKPTTVKLMISVYLQAKAQTVDLAED